MARDPEAGKQILDAYTEHKAGPLTGGLTATGFSSLRMVCPDLADAEINELVDKAHVYQSTMTSKQLHIQEQQLRDPGEAIVQWFPVALGADISKSAHLPEVFNHNIPGNWVTLAPVSTHLFSRGSVHIKSSDPTVHPTIDPKYMSHPLDTEIMGRVVLNARQLCLTEPWASKLKTGPDGKKVPIHGSLGPYSDPKTLEEAKEYVRWNCVTCYHPIGTCSMLPRDEGGVVDQNLKVYGTANVRVVDASIFPLHVQGNIMSLVYAIAEKAADSIRGNI
jgi:choline dehydrogenase